MGRPVDFKVKQKSGRAGGTAPTHLDRSSHHPAASKTGLMSEGWRLHGSPANKAALHSVEPESEEAAARLSRDLNRAVASLNLDDPRKNMPAVPSPRPSHSVYLKLFRRMDQRHRGCIDYDQFVDMVRDGLRISEDRMSDEQVAGLWRRGDVSASGVMATAGFVKLMKLGRQAFGEEQAKLQRRQPQWNQSVHRPHCDEPLWEDRTVTLKDQAAEREGARRIGVWQTLHEQSVVAGTPRRPVKKRRAKRRPPRSADGESSDAESECSSTTASSRGR